VRQQGQGASPSSTQLTALTCLSTFVRAIAAGEGAPRVVSAPFGTDPGVIFGMSKTLWASPGNGAKRPGSLSTSPALLRKRRLDNSVGVSGHLDPLADHGHRRDPGRQDDHEPAQVSRTTSHRGLTAVSVRSDRLISSSPSSPPAVGPPTGTSVGACSSAPSQLPAWHARRPDLALIVFLPCGLAVGRCRWPVLRMTRLDLGQSWNERPAEPH
jgi:hypothetical protein